MLRRSLEIYEEYREPRDLRLRRSSRHENLEREYQKVYNIEEHILYRKQEISIHQTYQYYKYEKEWLYCLNKKCGIYTEESVYELLGLYLVGESMVERKQDMKNNGVSFEFKRQKSDNGRDICVSLYEFVGSL